MVAGLLRVCRLPNHRDHVANMSRRHYLQHASTVADR